MEIHVLARLLTILYVIHTNVKIIFTIVEPTCASRRLGTNEWSPASIAISLINASSIVGIIKIKLLQNTWAIWMYQMGLHARMTHHTGPCVSWVNVSQRAATRKLAKKQLWLLMNVEFAEAEEEVVGLSEATLNKSEFGSCIPSFML